MTVVVVDPGDAVVTYPPFAVRRGAARATTWWGRAWVRAVEEAALVDDDLRRGRSLSRSGAIGGINLSRGAVAASVGDPTSPATAVVRLPMLDDTGIATLVEAVASESGRIGALLAGDLPHDLVEHADESGVELVPFGAELEASCTCYAYLDPCPHALAVLYQVTWLLEADPLVLLHLRGLPRDDLLARLHVLGPASDTPALADPDDLQLETAIDAALRAGRLVELLDEPGADVDHLF